MDDGYKLIFYGLLGFVIAEIFIWQIEILKLTVIIRFVKVMESI